MRSSLRISSLYHISPYWCLGYTETIKDKEKLWPLRKNERDVVKKHRWDKIVGTLLGQ